MIGVRSGDPRSGNYECNLEVKERKKLGVRMDGEDGA
jgi:hypothetical protein